jgi:hypothetical protein
LKARARAKEKEERATPSGEAVAQAQRGPASKDLADFSNEYSGLKLSLKAAHQRWSPVREQGLRHIRKAPGANPAGTESSNPTRPGLRPGPRGGPRQGSGGCREP